MYHKPSIALLIKRSSENLPNTVDDVIAQMVYGNLRRPPGDDNCPYKKLLLKKEEEDTTGIWTPPNSLCKAMGLKWLFPNVSGQFKLPEEKVIPPHLIVGYDAFKYKEVMELATQFPGSVMKYGFFNTDVPGEAELITKTVEKFEKKMTPTNYEEKIIIQLMKTPESFGAFLELGPSYASPDTVQGADEAKMFFPDTYDIPEDVIMEIKKKPKKKVKGKFVAVVEAHEDEILQLDKENAVEATKDTDEDVLADEAQDQAEGKDAEGEEEDGEEYIEEIDKATSPMSDGRVDEVGTE